MSKEKEVVLNKDGLAPGALVSEKDHIRIIGEKRKKQAKDAKAEAELKAKKAAKK